MLSATQYAQKAVDEHISWWFVFIVMWGYATAQNIAEPPHAFCAEITWTVPKLLCTNFNLDAPVEYDALYLNWLNPAQFRVHYYWIDVAGPNMVHCFNQVVHYAVLPK